MELVTQDKEQVTLEMIQQDWGLLATGVSGWINIEQAWLRRAQKVFATFCAKQHDYGPNNIAVAGVTGVVLRMGDKISRLFELTGLGSKKASEGMVSGEALADTLDDLADYGIIARLVLEGAWPVVHANEVWGIEDSLRQILEKGGAAPDDFGEILALWEKYGPVGMNNTKPAGEPTAV